MQIERGKYQTFYKCGCGAIIHKVITSSKHPKIEDAKKHYSKCAKCGRSTDTWKVFTGRDIVKHVIKRKWFIIPVGEKLEKYVEEKNGNLYKA